MKALWLQALAGAAGNVWAPSMGARRRWARLGYNLEPLLLSAVFCFAACFVLFTF
jgi:hypothetical protein